MIKFILSLSLFTFLSFEDSQTNMELSYIRKHYQEATVKKEICAAMIDGLENSALNNIKLAYLGGLQTIWANHTNNPISKLKTFDIGKANLEKAVKNERNNIEIRFIRLSVQKNCPKFLGYHKNIIEDERYLKKYINNVTPETLKLMIIDILSD